MRNIKQIAFPNNTEDFNKSFYEVGRNIDKIVPIVKSGEMAGIQWFQLIKDNKIIAEIKESICDIYGEDEYTPPAIDF